MNRAHPVALRKSLEMAQALVKSGLEFVPIPSLGVEDYSALVDQLGNRMSQLARAAEAEEGTATAQAGAAGTDQTRAEVAEELQAAVAILRGQLLGNLANAVVAAHNEWVVRRVVPLVVAMPTFHGYQENIQRELQAAFKQAIEASGGSVAP